MAAASVASAQATKPDRPTSVIGVNAGALTDGAGPLIPTYGIQWTRLRCPPLCGDLAVGISPAGGAGMRLGVTAPLPVGTGAFFLPSAGLSGVIGPSFGNNTAATGGVFAGASIVMGINWGVAFRGDATLHWIVPLQSPVWLLEVGIAVPLWSEHDK